MVRLIMISRTRDGLLLCASMDNDNHSRELEPFKKRARQLIQSSIGVRDCQHTNVEDPPLYFLYHIQRGVMYLSLCEKAYPKKLACAFLDELAQEFEVLHGDKIESAERPYAFIGFDTFIQKSKKMYTDIRSQRNLELVSEKLREVHSIYTRSITELIGRGEKIEAAQEKSFDLLSQTQKYEKAAVDLRRMMLFKKYAPILVVLLIIILFIFYKFIWLA